ncbi:MAG: hypothetical protein JRJ60_01010 [Deltaproteobacteria bacterium]|nr:hypothetical protein [Deltaproteobacteria bacterium]
MINSITSGFGALLDESERVSYGGGKRLKEQAMKVDQAIMGLSQSEKIKAGLIWVSQALELGRGLHPSESRGAEQVIKALVGMIGHEVRLARNIAPDDAWETVEKRLEQAEVMINSGVGPESVIHLTRAVSQTTGIGRRAMTLLKDKGLL